MRFHHRQQGFTLIELLVVVAIIVLLTTLAVPGVQAAVSRAREVRSAGHLLHIQDGLERHFVEQGSYPLKLSDLVTRGYLKAGIDLKVPGSGYWYFYAVDDNRAPGRSRAYVLGAPGKAAGADNHLYHGGPLPRGRNPNYRARAWLHYGSGQGLTLYHPDDVHPLKNTDPHPPTLGQYRTSCLPASTSPCDLRAN